MAWCSLPDFRDRNRPSRAIRHPSGSSAQPGQRQHVDRCEARYADPQRSHGGRSGQRDRRSARGPTPRRRPRARLGDPDPPPRTRRCVERLSNPAHSACGRPRGDRASSSARGARGVLAAAGALSVAMSRGSSRSVTRLRRRAHTGGGRGEVRGAFIRTGPRRRQERRHLRRAEVPGESVRTGARTPATRIEARVELGRASPTWSTRTRTRREDDDPESGRAWVPAGVDQAGGDPRRISPRTSGRRPYPPSRGSPCSSRNISPPSPPTRTSPRAAVSPARSS